MLEGDKDGPWTVTTLKVYFERIICDLNRRLTALDTFQATAKDKERDFYSRAQHDDFAHSIDQRLDQLHGEMEALRRPQWSVWIAAVTLFMSITGVLWWFAMQPIQIDIAHLKQQDEGLIEARKERGVYIDAQNKTINDRIDRLYELYRDLQTQHAEALRKLNGIKKPP